jgi:hypothetical protein
MKVYVCIASSLLLNTAIAQIDRGPINITPNGVIDGVVLKEEVPVRSKIEYEHIREADYVWSKRVFSRIDAREKMNHTIFLPYDYVFDDTWAPPSTPEEIDKNDKWVKHHDRFSLWTIIVKHIMLGDLTVYDVADWKSGVFTAIEDGYQFKYPIVRNQKLDYFDDPMYRKLINRKFSYGGPGAKWEIEGDDEDKTKKILTRDSKDETFEAWFQRITTTGDDQEIYAPLLRLDEKGKISKSTLKAQYESCGDNQPISFPEEAQFITSESITAYNIKEDWFFDKERSMLDKRIIAIAPVGRMKPLEEDEDGPNVNDGINRFSSFVAVNRQGRLQDFSDGTFQPDFSGQFVEKELFWLYFPELRDVMINYYVYNDQSDSQWMSFDDLFWKRRFTSTIYKVSDKFDREIEDYKKGVDALYRAEKIKDEIRTWEIDVWNY